MIVLIPLSRFRVPYATAYGRPYSPLELLVCRAVRDGAASIEALVDEFHVHRRLITQAVVTLIQDGFVALGGASDQALLPTREGQEAVARGRLSQTVVAPGRRAIVVMERLTGALAPNSEIRFEDESNVREFYSDAPRIAVRVTYNDLDGAQVRHLLPTGQGEWIQHIGVIAQLSKGAHWLAVDVDLQSNAVIGMPDRWERRVKPIILEAVRESGIEPVTEPRETPRLRPQRRRQVPDDDNVGVRLAPDEWPAAVAPHDVVTSTSELRARTANILTSASCRFLVIAAGEIDEEGVDAAAEEIAAASRRGVHLDVLWGRDAGGGLDRLKKLRYDLRDRGGLDFNQSSCPTAMEATIGVGADGVRGIIGGQGRLRASQNGSNLAVELRGAGVMSAIVLAAAGAWRASLDERLSGGPDRLNRIAADLAARPEEKPSADGGTIRVVLDRDHDLLITDALKHAAKRVTILSARPGVAAPARLLALLSVQRSEKLDLRAVIGAEPPAEIAQQLNGLLAAQGGRIEHRPGSACGLAADEMAMVGSFDPLGTGPYEGSRGTRHLSVQLSGEGAGHIADAFA